VRLQLEVHFLSNATENLTSLSKSVPYLALSISDEVDWLSFHVFSAPVVSTWSTSILIRNCSLMGLLIGPLLVASYVLLRFLA